MPSSSDFPARGKVIEAHPDKVVFAPANTTYTLHLATESRYAGPLDVPLNAVVRVQARKLYTVPSGGGFIQPITGEPRIIQGRVVWLSETQLVLRAGTHVLVDLPEQDDAFELGNGDIGIGTLVNVVALPGARFEVLQPVSV
jgi:hypothetical protein